MREGKEGKYQKRVSLQTCFEKVGPTGDISGRSRGSISGGL